MRRNWQTQPEEFLSIGIQGECAHRRTVCTTGKAQICNTLRANTRKDTEYGSQWRARMHAGERELREYKELGLGCAQADINLKP